jgi:hypothetical protein
VSGGGSVELTLGTYGEGWLNALRTQKEHQSVRAR